MENQSEKLDHQVAGLPSLCLASSRIQFSVHAPPKAEVVSSNLAGRANLRFSTTLLSTGTQAPHRAAGSFMVAAGLDGRG